MRLREWLNARPEDNYFIGVHRSPPFLVLNNGAHCVQVSYTYGALLHCSCNTSPAGFLLAVVSLQQTNVD